MKKSLVKGLFFCLHLETNPAGAGFTWFGY
jgi:hypothetical protein